MPSISSVSLSPRIASFDARTSERGGNRSLW
jgi:hypothetical protein